MEVTYIIGLAVSIILALIGILYRGMASEVKDNKNNIEEIDSKYDSRMDDAEKEIVIIKTKIEK